MKNIWIKIKNKIFYIYLWFLRHQIYSFLKKSYFLDMFRFMESSSVCKKKIKLYFQCYEKPILETFTLLYTNTANIIRVILCTVGLQNNSN